MFTTIILVAILVIMILVAKQVKLIDYLCMLVSIRDLEREIYNDKSDALWRMRTHNNIYRKVIGYKPPVMYGNDARGEYIIRFER